MVVGDPLAEVAGWIVADRPLDAALKRIADIALDAIPPADVASLTLVVKPHELTMGGSSEIAEALDERQRELGRGPCLDAAYGGSSVIVDDMRAEDRWRDYAPRAIQLGILSSLSAPLPAQQHVVAALNWYSTKPGAFDHTHLPLAEQFAARVAVAVTNAHLYAEATRVAEQMSDAMASRAVIEQAKGILMAQSKVDPDTAFNLLVRASQRENRKLREIAQSIVDRAVGDG